MIVADASVITVMLLHVPGVGAHRRTVVLRVFMQRLLNTPTFNYRDIASPIRTARPGCQS